MKIQKRHIILAALVLALGVAVYLNWQFDGSSSLVKETSKNLGEATYVNADAKATADEKKSEVLNNTISTEDDYFLTAETERSQAQDKAIDTAKEAVLSAESDNEIKKEAVTSLEKLENMIVAQSNIENILKAKGFTKCLCFISENNCSIAVYKKDMKEDSPLIIKDAVLSQYPIEFNNITIVEV
ncbi:MAG: SpoIIIAH-like family protein [Oscillospiraceae bacterium]|nr:SpoIIIAH-like family protein [Candidatus Ruminococcus equi]